MSLKKDISAIVITKNESVNIERCLVSLDFCKEIIVVDANSTDDTVSKVRLYTDKVFIEEWKGFSAQKEFALSKTSCNWVLWIDADEQVPIPLYEEIADLALENGNFKGYYLPRVSNYCGKWIRHGGWDHDFVLRLFDKQHGKFDGKPVHEGIIVNGPTSHLSSPLHHYPYRTLSHHINKIDTYTTLHAEAMAEAGKRATIGMALRHAFGCLARKLIMQKGYLDGSTGIVLAVMSSYYVFLKYAKLWEIFRMADRRQRE